MPVYPGTTPPQVDIQSEIDTAGFEERRLAFSTHTGTHVDAPAHILTEALDLSHLPLEHFYGRAMMLPLMIQPSLQISIGDLKPHGSRLAKAEFVLLHTGWSKYWGQTIYFTQFPILDAVRPAGLSILA